MISKFFSTNTRWILGENVTDFTRHVIYHVTLVATLNYGKSLPLLLVERRVYGKEPNEKYGEFVND